MMQSVSLNDVLDQNLNCSSSHVVDVPFLLSMIAKDPRGSWDLKSFRISLKLILSELFQHPCMQDHQDQTCSCTLVTFLTQPQ